MRSDLIDIQVEDYGDDVEITLSGSLGAFQLAAVREKIDMLADGPGCFFFLNLSHAHFKVNDYLDLFLELLNKLQSQNSKLVLIFDSEELDEYFAKYRRSEERRVGKECS